MQIAVGVVLALKVKSRSVLTTDTSLQDVTLTTCSAIFICFCFLQRMERGNYAYQSVVKGLSDREANDALNAFVSAREYCVCAVACNCIRFD